MSFDGIVAFTSGVLRELLEWFNSQRYNFILGAIFISRCMYVSGLYAHVINYTTSLRKYCIWKETFFFLCLQQEHYEATEGHDKVTLEPPRSFDDLQREVVSAESHHEEEFDDQRCIFCRNSPCILRSENLPDKLRASGPPRMTNHCKRKADYRALYTILKRKGLWRDPIYVQRKEALGCYIDDVREVMPVCVVEDVRKRWPNPDGVPYCGHRRTWRKL